MRSQSIQQKSHHQAGCQLHCIQPATVISSFRCVSTTDANVLAKSLSKWQQEYLQISPGQFAGSIKEFSIGEVQIFREVINKSVDQHGQPLPGRFTVGIPVSMHGEAYWCGNEFSSADSVLFLRPDYELKFKTPVHSDIYGASIDTGAFMQFSSNGDYYDSSTFRHLKELNSLPPGNCAAFRQAFDSFFRAIELTPRLLESESAKKQLTFDIMNLILRMTSEIPVSKKPYANQFIHRHIVDNARQYILSRRSEALTVTDLCEGLRTSHRSLHYAFNKVLGISPVTYLRYVRLNGARADLISSDKPILISEAATKWGFWHMGMFSLYYKSLFGEQPSETRKAYRTTAIN